jgi:hypothetical protein
MRNSKIQLETIGSPTGTAASMGQSSVLQGGNTRHMMNKNHHVSFKTFEAAAGDRQAAIASGGDDPDQELYL